MAILTRPFGPDNCCVRSDGDAGSGATLLSLEVHTATEDCNALLEVLARPAGEGGTPPFSKLLRSSQRSGVRTYAENAPFDMKEYLKSRGYRWSDGSDGRPRAWWIEIDDELEEEELRYLRTEIYGWEDTEPLQCGLRRSIDIKPRASA
ncbi:hypothetical protein [Bosea lathyri]|uniref:hypothetical protein n=1 Tax=Bosea lathyri TaxID=1036778 RepID=UPI0011B04EAC|nr:hypothetical protein [Bosea lathyri]